MWPSFHKTDDINIGLITVLALGLYIFKYIGRLAIECLTYCL